MGLTVAVVGAGLVGLATALALARADEAHNVHLFERSDLEDEYGGDLQFHPSGTRALASLGIDVEQEMPVSDVRFHRAGIAMNEHGEFQYMPVADSEELAAKLGMPGKYLHTTREACHAVLLGHLLVEPNITLHRGTPVLAVSAVQGSLHLSNGERFLADLIVGADGVQSVCFEPFRQLRPRTEGTEPLEPFTNPYHCYGGFLPSSEALAHPDVRPFLDSYDWRSTASPYLGPGVVFSLWPVKCGELLSVHVHVPREMDIPWTSSVEQRAKNESVPWHYSREGQGRDLKRLMPLWAKPFHAMLDLLDKSDMTNGKRRSRLYHWAEVNRDAPRRMTLGRLVLVGDAAHPMLSRYLAAQTLGFEEAAALGDLFRPGTSRPPGYGGGGSHSVRADEVYDRLELFNKLRYKRAMRIKYASDLLALGGREKAETKLERRIGEALPDEMGIRRMLWEHDAVAEARAGVMDYAKYE